MTAMTFASLSEDITSYLLRTDVATVDKVPFFIFLAEQRCCKDIINIGIETVAVSNFTVGLSAYPKPSQWRTNLNMNFGSGTGFNTVNNLILTTYEFANIYWPDRTVLGFPKYYAEYGFNNFLVVPTPDTAYPFEFSYLSLPEPLSINNQTNWLTNYAADVLFYASMLEAVTFVKDFELVDQWGARYQAALTSLNQQDVRRKDDRYTKLESD